MTDRTNEEARRGVPMSAEQVRGFIAKMAADKTSKAARIRMAEAAIERGNITPEGKAVWRDYLAGLKADAAPSLRDALTASLAQEGEAA